MVAARLDIQNSLQYNRPQVLYSGVADGIGLAVLALLSSCRVGSWRQRSSSILPAAMASSRTEILLLAGNFEQ